MFDFFDHYFFFSIFDIIDYDNKTYCGIIKNKPNHSHVFGPKCFDIANNHDNIMDEKTNDNNDNDDDNNNNASDYDV